MQTSLFGMVPTPSELRRTPRHGASILLLSVSTETPCLRSSSPGLAGTLLKPLFLCTDTTPTDGRLDTFDTANEWSPSCLYMPLPFDCTFSIECEHWIDPSGRTSLHRPPPEASGNWCEGTFPRRPTPSCLYSSTNCSPANLGSIHFYLEICWFGVDVLTIPDSDVLGPPL